MYTSLLVAGPGNDVLESDDPSGESSPSPSSTPISSVRRRGECVCVGGGGVCCVLFPSVNLAEAVRVCQKGDRSIANRSDIRQVENLALLWLQV